MAIIIFNFILYIFLDIIPVRFNIALSIFFALVLLFMVRANFSIAILAMVEPTGVPAGNATNKLQDVSNYIAFF